MLFQPAYLWLYSAAPAMADEYQTRHYVMGWAESKMVSYSKTMFREPLYTAVLGLVRALWFVQGLKFTVTGLENVPAHGGAVLAINHTGYMEFTYAGLPMRKHKRLIRYMAKSEAFNNPIAGPLLRGMHHIPVDRVDGNSSYDSAVAALRSGELVGVFPEASISSSFEIKKFKSGVVRMALDARVPIIPIVIWGGQRVWTKGLPRRFGRNHFPIYVDVGKPFYVYEPIEDSVEELRSHMKDTLGVLQKRYGEEHGPYPKGATWVPAKLGGGAPTPEEADVQDKEVEERRRSRRKAKEQLADAAARVRLMASSATEAADHEDEQTAQQLHEASHTFAQAVEQLQAAASSGLEEGTHALQESAKALQDAGRYLHRVTSEYGRKTQAYAKDQGTAFVGAATDVGSRALESMKGGGEFVRGYTRGLYDSIVERFEQSGDGLDDEDSTMFENMKDASDLVFDYTRGLSSPEVEDDDSSQESGDDRNGDSEK